MRVVFLGTPEFAVPSLEALARRHEVALVLTQPDRPRGRGRQIAEPPVKARALALGLPVVQPERLDEGTLRPRFAEAGAEAAVVVAYGLMIPPWLLAFHARGAINVHASLLPAYRGAAPVNRAIINGDAETGVTTMLLVERMDAGPVLLQRATPIAPDETAGELAARLAKLGAELLLETLDALAAGTVRPQPQEESRASFAPKMSKDDGRIDWSAPARRIVDLVRGVSPWPGAQTTLDGAPLKIWRAAAAALPAGAAAGAAPGTVLAASAREGIVVACGGGGALALLCLQAEGKKPLPAAEFLRGHGVGAGARFGCPAAGEADRR